MYLGTPENEGEEVGDWVLTMFAVMVSSLLLSPRLQPLEGESHA
jgi:hypothetical protein